MKKDTYREFLALLRRLEEAKISYTLGCNRDDALMIIAVVPGERWEIEFVDYDDEIHIEIERFVSSGRIEDESALDDLFTRFSDKEEPIASHDHTT